MSTSVNDTGEACVTKVNGNDQVIPCRPVITQKKTWILVLYTLPVLPILARHLIGVVDTKYACVISLIDTDEAKV